MPMPGLQLRVPVHTIVSTLTGHQAPTPVVLSLPLCVVTKSFVRSIHAVVTTVANKFPSAKDAGAVAARSAKLLQAHFATKKPPRAASDAQLLAAIRLYVNKHHRRLAGMKNAVAIATESSTSQGRHASAPTGLHAETRSVVEDLALVVELLLQANPELFPGYLAK